MHTFIIKPTKKTLRWLVRNKISKNAMQYALNMTFADVNSKTRYKKTDIVLQVDYKRAESSYIFGTNKIYICSDPEDIHTSQRQKKFVIFLHFLHEFRHWMQSKILKIKDSQLCYTDRDVAYNTLRYRNNKFEVDARKFERSTVRKFMRYYKQFISYYR